MKRIPAPKVIKRQQTEKRVICIPQSKVRGDK